MICFGDRFISIIFHSMIIFNIEILYRHWHAK